LTTTKKTTKTTKTAQSSSSNKLEELTQIQVDAEIYRQEFYEFAKAAFQVVEPGVDFVDNWHIQYLCDKLQEYAERVGNKQPRKKHLIINMPVRGMKSVIVSILYKVWTWVRFPHLFINNYSYSEDLLETFNRQVKLLISSEWFATHFSDLKLRSDSGSVMLFRNTVGGQMFSSTVRGQATGFGANISIIDDPQNPKMAKSEAENKAVQEWWSGTLSTRFRDPRTDIKIIVMQRLTENDLTAYALRKNPDAYEVICIPAEETDDIRPEELRKFYKGGLYWEKRFDKEFLADQKIELGSVDYASQFLQRPAPAEGLLFKSDWFKTISKADFVELTKNQKPVWNFVIDPAETEKKDNDPSGILVYTYLNNNWYILKARNERKEFTKLIAFLKEYIPQFYTPESRVYIEGKSSGKSLISQLKQETSFNVIEVQPGKDSKYLRAESITPIVESGRVFLIEDSWNADFIHQLVTFPNGAHDELVDCLTYCVKQVKTNSFDYSFI